MSTVEQVNIPAPEFRGGNLELGACRDLEVCLDGPAGCIAGETRIYNPVTGDHVPVKELYEKKIAPVVQTLMGAMQAEVPFRKGVADLYRLTLASGRKCIVTQNHLLLSDNSWIYLAACVPGTRLLISSPCLYPTTEAHGPLVSQQDALRLSQRPLNSQECYSVYSHRYGVQPRLAEDIDQDVALPQDDVLLHTHAGLCRDDLVSLSAHTHQHQRYAHHSRSGCSPSPVYMVDTLSHDQQETSLQVGAWSQYDVQSLNETFPPLPIAQFLLDGDSKLHHALSLMEHHCVGAIQPHDVSAYSIPRRLMPCSVCADRTQGLLEAPLQWRVYNPSCNASNAINSSINCDYTAQWDTVSSIQYVRTDEYFDLHVPQAEHYLAEGIWHHNTGKTYAALFKVHTLLTLYPGAKALVARKTNTALSGSAIATYREMIDPREGVRYFGGNKIRPAAFEYPNGSVLIVNGLDRPEKVKSVEIDLSYINEASECSVEDIEFVRSRLRHGCLPYHQLILDTNPDAPTHWLNVRMNEGITKRLVSRHEHNPRYFDFKTNDWTPDGRAYIEGVLGGLTGVRLARLRYGIWAAAEGTVFEGSYDRSKNVIKRFPIPKDWPVYMSLDFGFVHPFVCKWYAEDPDGRLYCYREIYMTHRLVEEHAKQIKQLSKWGQPGGDPLPRVIYADHDAEGRATFERHTGLNTTAAHKAVSEGIQAMATRLRPAGDGKPRLMYFEDCLVETDQELAKAKKPTCTIEEFDSYIWDTRQGMKKGEQPVKESDHGMDCDRYICARDLAPTGVGYIKGFWR